MNIYKELEKNIPFETKERLGDRWEVYIDTDTLFERCFIVTAINKANNLKFRTIIGIDTIDGLKRYLPLEDVLDKIVDDICTKIIKTVNDSLFVGGRYIIKENYKYGI